MHPTSRFGGLNVEGHRVKAFREKPKAGDSELISAGFFVFNRGFFEYLNSEEDCDLERGPLERIAEQGQMMVYKHERFWFCMDTQRDVDMLNEMWQSGRAEWKIWM